MKCQFTKPDNTQCEANAMTDAEFCFIHNPEVRTEKDAAISKGGMAPKPRKEDTPLPPLPVKKIEDVIALMEDTINRIRTEPMTHQKANCVGYLANITLKALEVGEIDDKLELINSLILGRKSKR